MKMNLCKAFLVITAFILGTGVKAENEIKLELKEPGKFYIATEGTYPPFNMYDKKGNLDGLEVRIVKEICRRLELEYVPVIAKWESFIPGILAGKYDMVSDPMDITSERKKIVEFSDPWIESGGKVVVREDSSISSNKDIINANVGVLIATTWGKAAEDLGVKNIKTYKSEMEAILDLKNKRIDAVITDAITIDYLIKEHKLPLKMLDGYLNKSSKGFVFKPGHNKLVDAVNKVLYDIKKDGTYKNIIQEFINPNILPSSSDERTSSVN